MFKRYFLLKVIREARKKYEGEMIQAQSVDLEWNCCVFEHSSLEYVCIHCADLWNWQLLNLLG